MPLPRKSWPYVTLAVVLLLAYCACAKCLGIQDRYHLHDPDLLMTADLTLHAGRATTRSTIADLDPHEMQIPYATTGRPRTYVLTWANGSQTECRFSLTGLTVSATPPIAPTHYRRDWLYLPGYLYW